MKSKIWKGLKVKSELKPVIGISNPAFVFTRGADLATKFRLINEAKAAEKVENVTPIKRKKGNFNA